MGKASTNQMCRDELAGVPEIAAARGWTYRKAYDALLRGTFGPPVRVDGRLYARRDAVQQEALQRVTPSSRINMR